MLRGHVSLYKSLFNEETSARAKPQRKGRNEVHLQSRNELLVHRYWYYVKIKGLNYPQTLDILENIEFFLTPGTIAWIIKCNFNVITELKAARPDAAYFKKKYPFMVW